MAVLRRELAEDEGLRYTSGRPGKERS